MNRNKDKIECFYLPSYSPELNPEERLNSDLKHAIGSKVPVRTKEKLRNAANDHMMMLEKNPERVASYFQDPLVKYVAWNYLMAGSITWRWCMSIWKKFYAG